MSKKKDSVALFEVIARHRDKQHEAGLAVPSWMGKPDEPSDPEATGSAAASGAVTEPIISTDAERLTLSLTYRMCLVLAAAELTVMVFVFWLGWVSAPNAVSPARNEPTVTETVSGTSARQPGQYYLIIQGLQGLTPQHQLAGERIVRFLGQNGVEADLAKWGGDSKQYVVWSRKGFDSPTSDAAVTFAEQVEALGRQYRDQGGRYDFKQKRDSSGKIEPWFGQVKR